MLKFVQFLVDLPKKLYAASFVGALGDGVSPCHREWLIAFELLVAAGSQVSSVRGRGRHKRRQLRTVVLLVPGFGVGDWVIILFLERAPICLSGSGLRANHELRYCSLRIQVRSRVTGVVDGAVGEGLAGRVHQVGWLDRKLP